MTQNIFGLKVLRSARTALSGLVMMLSLGHVASAQTTPVEAMNAFLAQYAPLQLEDMAIGDLRARLLNAGFAQIEMAQRDTGKSFERLEQDLVRSGELAAILSIRINTCVDSEQVGRLHVAFSEPTDVMVQELTAATMRYPQMVRREGRREKDGRGFHRIQIKANTSKTASGQSIKASGSVRRYDDGDHWAGITIKFTCEEG